MPGLRPLVLCSYNMVNTFFGTLITMVINGYVYDYLSAVPLE